MATSSHSEVKREHNQKTCEKGKQNGGGAPAGDEGKPAEMPTIYSSIFLSPHEIACPYHYLRIQKKPKKNLKKSSSLANLHKFPVTNWKLFIYGGLYPICKKT